MLKHSLKTGFSFGVTSGIITTLGLMVGLHSGTNSKLAVIGGILTIAIADAFSDALGIHVSEESENVHTPQEVWEATISTFVCKFVFSLSFLVPVLLLSLSTAIVASIAWGLLVLGLQSYRLGQGEGGNGWRVVAEHLLIAVVVIFLTHYAGELIAKTFS
ncbi:MAG: hypothetical protein ABH823_01145 [bacterium]